MLVLHEPRIVQKMQQGVTGATCDHSINDHVNLSTACSTAEEQHPVKRQSHSQTHVRQVATNEGLCHLHEAARTTEKV